MRFAAWKFGLDVKFVKEGTLKTRKICDDREIVDWPLERLLTLDNGTSQWGSASILMGNKERLKDADCFLKITYDVVDHWNSAREKGETWEPRYDSRIERQAVAYLNYLRTGEMDFVPEHSEDYCFARGFDLITKEEGEERWPSLREHESDRIEEMEKSLGQKKVTSKDHRIVQINSLLRGSMDDMMYPEAVNKSWPQCPTFLKDSPILCKLK